MDIKAVSGFIMDIKAVSGFMDACGQTTYVYNADQLSLYKKLIEEEYEELFAARTEEDFLEELDACCDLAWVTLGAILSTGYSEDDFVNEIIMAVSDYDEIRESKSEKLVDQSDSVIDWTILGFDYSNLMLATDLDDIMTKACNLLCSVQHYAITGDYKFDQAFAEVQRSNMSKVDPVTGKVIKREDGKILKPDTFSPPDLIPFL